MHYQKYYIMKVNPETFDGLEGPVYVLEENRLRNNLSLISRVASEADVEIILAFKRMLCGKHFPSSENIYSQPRQVR